MTGFSNYILLAEDNPADIHLVREALEDRSIGCDLHIVSDGEQAFRFIERIENDESMDCPRLLLLDLHLPKRDGGDVLRRLRESGRCAQTPVVMMTTLSSPSDSRNMAAHSAHYFQKPTTLEQFLQLGDVVKDILGQKAGA